jgi:hypothetical protein
MFKLFGLKVCLQSYSRHLLTIRRVTLTLFVEFEFSTDTLSPLPELLTPLCSPHYHQMQLAPTYIHFSMSSAPPCNCTQFTDPRAVFLRSLTHYDSCKNARSFFTTQWHVCNHVASVRFRVKGPPTIPLHVPSAGSRYIQGSKPVAGLLRLSRVQCCPSAVPAKSSHYQAPSASLGCLHCHPSFATWSRLLSAFSIGLAVKPYFPLSLPGWKAPLFRHCELTLKTATRPAVKSVTCFHCHRPFISPLLHSCSFPLGLISYWAAKGRTYLNW